MKKIIAAALALSVLATGYSQEIPERKHGRHHPPGRHGKMHHRRPGGMDFKQLNLTEAQKEQMKTEREGFRKQMEALKKNDNITVKEWRSKMETLRKDQKSRIENILTSDQKAKLEKIKTDRKTKHEEMMKGRADRMKNHLGLSAEQSAKFEKNRAEMQEKMKAIRENKSLSEERKREEMKELMKKNKESMRSILTKEQLKKMKEGRHHGPHKEGKKSDETKKETI